MALPPYTMLSLTMKEPCYLAVTDRESERVHMQSEREAKLPHGLWGPTILEKRALQDTQYQTDRLGTLQRALKSPTHSLPLASRPLKGTHIPHPKFSGRRETSFSEPQRVRCTRDTPLWPLIPSSPREGDLAPLYVTCSFVLIIV